MNIDFSHKAYYYAGETEVEEFIGNFTQKTNILDWRTTPKTRKITKNKFEFLFNYFFYFFY